MKKFFILSMLLISIGMICSCQKQDSAAEQQLVQRKAELDAREQAFDERVNALDEKVNAVVEKVNALVEKEKATTNAWTIAPDVQVQVPDPAQVNARIQQLPANAPALIADPSQVNSARAEKDRRAQERLAQSQRGPEDAQSRRQRKFEAIQKWQISGAAISPTAKAPSPTPQ
jgi:hypothetical protein